MERAARRPCRGGQSALGSSSLVAVALMAMSLVHGPTAQAHMAQTKVVRAQPWPGGARLEVDVPLLEAAVGLGLGSDPADSDVLEEAKVLEQWLGTRLEVLDEDEVCAATETSAAVRRASQRAVLTISLIYRCPSGRGRLYLRDTSLTEGDHETMVWLDGQPASVLRDAESLTPLHSGGGFLGVFSTFLFQGLVHLVTGYDHLLFLLSLLIVLGLRTRASNPLKTAALMVTAFTGGHSLTLIAAALGWVELPVEPVEAAIALSIVFVAVLNIARPSAHSLRPSLAFGFGLVHGLGFSAVLSELGLDKAHELTGLLAFNIGIELGQLAFVLALALPLIHLGHRRWYRPVVVTGGSAVVAVVASAWFVERTGLL